MCSLTLRRITDTDATLGGTLPSASFAPRLNRLCRLSPQRVAGACFTAAILLLQVALWNRTAELRALRHDAGALVLSLVAQQEQLQFRGQQVASGERAGLQHGEVVELAEDTGEREDHYHGGQDGHSPPLAVLLAHPQLLLRTVCRGALDGRAQQTAGFGRHGGRRAALSVLPTTAGAAPHTGPPTALKELCEQARASVSAAAGGMRAPADAAAARAEAMVVVGAQPGAHSTPGGVGAKALAEAGGSVAASSALAASASPGTDQPIIFVGIFVGGRPTLDPHRDYALRRAAIRSTWLAHDEAGDASSLAAGAGSSPQRAGGWRRHVLVRFVVGRVPVDQEGHAAAAAALQAEAEAFGDFMRLPDVEERYGSLSAKTLSYFCAVVAQHPSVRWVVKADDDVYLVPSRLVLAAQQWARIGAGYAGCMKHGVVRTDPTSRWFEPHHLLLGPTYYLHAYGSLYVLSSDVVRRVLLHNRSSLRLLYNEDTAVGLWLLAHDVMHFEDMRLCVDGPGCGAAGVAVAPPGCAGLCDPLADMAAAHANATCREAGHAGSGLEEGGASAGSIGGTAQAGQGWGSAWDVRPLPFLPSYPEHKAFERLWVLATEGAGKQQ